MNRKGRMFQICAGALLLAMLLTVTGPVKALNGGPAAAAMIFFGTGRAVRPLAAEPVRRPPDSPPVLPLPPDRKPDRVSFTAEDARTLEAGNFTGYPLDVQAMLRQPLNWNLRGPGPTVLIFHTHTTESYADTDRYVSCGAFHTLNEQYSVVQVGEELTAALTRRGIGVIHDRTLHDYPSYNSAYPLARDTVAAYLEKYPGLQLILDLHRDAAEDRAGNQVAFTAQVRGVERARLMVVVGTDSGGLHHPNWKQNLALGVKLHARLEQLYPGLCRPLAFRSQRYNQDQFPGMLLVEVGAAGNTLDQALAAMEPLAEAIGTMANGTCFCNLPMIE